MIILQEYKSVVFWLIFMSLWIISCLPKCNEGEEHGNKKRGNTNGNIAGNYGNVNNYYNQANPANNNDVNIIQYPINNNQQMNNRNINNYDVQLNQIGFLSSEIESEPKIGLANIGATCYMNATLQCLSHTVKLVNFFLDPRNEDQIKNKELSKELLEVFKKLWIKKYNKNKNDYEPYKFKQTISEMNPLFAGVAANDAKDLINFILQELHTELNLANNDINNYNNNNGNMIQQDQTNEQQMLTAFLEEFKKTQKSIISDLFFFIIMTKTECLNCKQINMSRGIYNPIYLYNFQIMNFLIFPLETVREYKCGLYGQNFTEVDLNDCFMHYQKVELMQGENQMWCKYCGQNSVSQYITNIYSPPTYLVLILNRGKGNCYNVKLNFGEILDIGNYVRMKENKNVIYHLYAIVTHLGPSNMGGHFIAFCKSPIDSKWYRFNDSLVSYEGNFNNVSNFGIPYILFYEKQN